MKTYIAGVTEHNIQNSTKAKQSSFLTKQKI